MDISLVFVRSQDMSKYLVSIWGILLESNYDYTPPLSQRDLSRGRYELITGEDTGEPTQYFESILKNYFVLVLSGGEVVGYTCFNHSSRVLEDAIYVSSTCISKKYRNRGIGRLLYQYLENEIPYEYRRRYITRCTWSTNTRQIHLYESMGYVEIWRSPNQRGIGVDTVYFAKEIKPNQLY